MSNTSRSKEVVTRKPHICDQCNKTIPAGSKAENVNGIWFGDDDCPKHTFNLYYCLECIEAGKDDTDYLAEVMG